MKTKKFITQIENVGAHNYHPIPVVIKSAKGVWVWDVEGKKYLDMLSAYSALNQGHCHPKMIETAINQMNKLTLTSRAFHNDKMGDFLQKLTKLADFEKALLMNTGAEAVETAIKAARRWGYSSKNIPENKAEIIVCERNFHGRTTTIISFSTDELCRNGFGPFTTGFKIIPYNDSKALEKAITKNTVGFLVEPIQGEAGVKIPDDNFLKKCRKITKKHDILLMVDEIQTGLGRTGKLFCYQHADIKPDIVMIGKALGGGLYPVSGILADRKVMDVAFKPGNHGSTFGGNPLACTIASTAIDIIIEEKLITKSAKLGRYFKAELKKIDSSLIKEVRGKGLLLAIELSLKAGKARKYTEKLKELGVLAKETHQTIIRFAPPLIITKKEIDWAIQKISSVF